MAQSYELQCEYKQIDWFQTPDGVDVKVWLKRNKHSIKRYCEDVELPFEEGLRRLYGKHRIRERDLLDDSYIRHSLNKGKVDKGITTETHLKAKGMNEQKSN